MGVFPSENVFGRDHFEARRDERGDLLGIIGEQAHMTRAEGSQHFCRKGEATLIEAESEHFIGMISVQSLRLQVLGADFVGEPVAAAFLIQIEQHAAAVLGHVARSVSQLVPAIAFEAAEEIAGEAGRVQPDGAEKSGEPITIAT